MRIVKQAEERRNEILDTAEKLFVTKGYDHTSTSDILSEIGIARGTLYYHFKSKEDILDAAIERINRRMIAQAAEIVRNKELPVLQRLTMTMMSLQIEGDFGAEVMTQIHKPQNALLHQKMQDGMLGGIIPLLTELAQEGIEQGIFHTDYPAGTVEMIMVYASTSFDDSMEYCDEEQSQQKMEGFIYNLERLLGMESGSMQAAMAPIFENSGKRND